MSRSNFLQFFADLLHENVDHFRAAETAADDWQKMFSSVQSVLNRFQPGAAGAGDGGNGDGAELEEKVERLDDGCLLYTSPSPRDRG